VIYINPNSTKVLKAKREFFIKMSILIKNRIDELYFLPGLNIPITKQLFKLYINDNLDEILVGNPRVLDNLNVLIKPFIEISPDFKRAITYVFNYDWFISKCVNRYDAYKLATALDVNTCTYCNRNYTNTIITLDHKKITRPQFDHFFDKDKNPLLALSFFNLIPSCTICNTNIKHGKTFELISHIHPYVNNVINDFRFTYRFSSKSKNGLKITIISPSGSKIEKTFKDMSLETVYNAHTYELKDLLDIRYKFSDRYLTILSSNIFTSIRVSHEELYRLAFGTEYLEENFDRRPFSKFKKDILTELNII
jgi:hypothetical protein